MRKHIGDMIMKNIREILETLNIENVQYMSEDFAHYNENNILIQSEKYAIQSVFGWRTFKTEKGFIKAIISL